MSEPRTLSNICQVCLVVKDLRAAMDKYASLGIGPFSVYTVDTKMLPGVTYRGAAANYRAQVAMAKIGTLWLELMEHQEGENIYKEHLQKHGEGLHHFGIFVDDYKAACDHLTGQGYRQIMGGPIIGKDREGRFDYFETEKGYGAIIELLDMPDDLGKPTYTYP